MAPSPRAFVHRQTRLRPVPSLGDLRLHLAEEILPLWRALQLETGDPDTPLPYWAFAWGGGQAIARYLDEHRDLVAGGSVLDIASGSGLCAIAAARAGATQVTAVDIDPFAAAAIDLNARANHVHVGVVLRDLLDEPPPAVDVILAGDCWYEAGLAARVLPWLQAARDQGSRVLIGDPGRRDLPTLALTQRAAYDVRTTTELEDLLLNRGMVYVLRDRPS